MPESLLWPLGVPQRHLLAILVGLESTEGSRAVTELLKGTLVSSSYRYFQETNSIAGDSCSLCTVGEDERQ